MLDPRRRRWLRLFDDLPGRVGRVEAWDDGAAPAGEGHQHHVPTLIACLAGTVRVHGPGRRCDLQPGDVLLVAPGTWHRHGPLRAGAVALGQGFLGRWSDVALHDAADGWSGCVPAQPGRLLMERALAAPAGERRAATVELLRQLAAEELRPLPMADTDAVQRMFAAMWSRLHLGVRAADLVRASGLGRTRAYALFNAAYGAPPHRAILAARLDLAAGLAAAGLPPVAVARRCGWRAAAAWRRVRRRAAAAQG